MQKNNNTQLTDLLSTSWSTLLVSHHSSEHCRLRWIKQINTVSDEKGQGVCELQNLQLCANKLFFCSLTCRRCDYWQSCKHTFLQPTRHCWELTAEVETTWHGKCLQKLFTVQDRPTCERRRNSGFTDIFTNMPIAFTPLSSSYSFILIVNNTNVIDIVFISIIIRSWCVRMLEVLVRVRHSYTCVSNYLDCNSFLSIQHHRHTHLGQEDVKVDTKQDW